MQWPDGKCSHPTIRKGIVEHGYVRRGPMCEATQFTVVRNIFLRAVRHAHPCNAV